VPPEPTGLLRAAAVGQPAGIKAASDDALLSAAGRGDQASMAVLFDRHAPRVYGLGLALLRDAHAAEDALQETFLRVWRFADGFDPRRGSATAWLLTIARNVCADSARARGSTVVLDPALLTVLDEANISPGPEDAMQVAEEVRRVRAALAALPDEQRRALLLARWHGRSATEIAAYEGVPVGTVRSRLRLALGRLRLVLSDDDIVTEWR